FCHGTVQKRLVRGVSRNLKTQVATAFAEVQRKRISLNCISESRQSLREMVDIAQRDDDIGIRRKYWLNISIDCETAYHGISGAGLFQNRNHLCKSARSFSHNAVVDFNEFH